MAESKMTTLFDNQEVKQLTYEERIASGETVRALWWKQPFASLMLHGKEYETRTRPTKVRGLVLICSTIKPYTADEVAAICGSSSMVLKLCNALFYAQTKTNGHAIGIGELVDSFPMLPEHEGKAFVEYHPSRYVWQMMNARPIEPFPLPGKQGWSIIDNETRNKIKFI